MPISSGALEWPASYYSKPSKEAADGTVDEGTSKGSKKSPRGGQPPQDYQWQPKLTTREDYEKWRKKMDRKDPLKTIRKRKFNCFGFLSSSKINTENEDPTKGERRDSPREVMKRSRRRRCILLTFCISLFTFILMAMVVYAFLHYTGYKMMIPKDLVQCSGQWRSHYFGQAHDSTNGTTTYTCCYIPDMDNYTVYTMLHMSASWPDGYLVPKGMNCPAPSQTSCEKYADSDFVSKTGLHKAPCSACRWGDGGWGFTLLCLLGSVMFRA